MKRGETNSQMLAKIDRFNHPHEQSPAKCYNASALEQQVQHTHYTSQWLLTCVPSYEVTLSFSTLIICHCSNSYVILDTSSQVSNGYLCLSHIFSATDFSISPLHSVEGSISLWFSPHQRYRGCGEFGNCEVCDYFRSCEGKDVLSQIKFTKALTLKPDPYSPSNIAVSSCFHAAGSSSNIVVIHYRLVMLKQLLSQTLCTKGTLKSDMTDQSVQTETRL